MFFVERDLLVNEKTTCTKNSNFIKGYKTNQNINIEYLNFLDSLGFPFLLLEYYYDLSIFIHEPLHVDLLMRRRQLDSVYPSIYVKSGSCAVAAFIRGKPVH